MYPFQACVQATQDFSILQFEDLLKDCVTLSEPDEAYGQTFIEKDESPQALKLKMGNS